LLRITIATNFFIGQSVDPEKLIEGKSVMKLLVTGASGFDDVPGLAEIAAGLDVGFAKESPDLAVELPGAEILLGWNFKGNRLPDYWHLAENLKWIHWCGAGVDGLLFPELTASEVIVTNARGLFDRAMAEYVLGLMLAQAKDMPQTFGLQAKHQWQHRMTETINRRRVLIFGVGSIGREIARMLKAVGMEVAGVGRTLRSADRDFGTICDRAGGIELAREVDWVVGVLPETSETIGYFDATFFAALKPTARFINIGRGSAVDEPELLKTLLRGNIAGAALDVFANEPLPDDDPLWAAPNLIVSPHMSGDYHGFEDDLAGFFARNLELYKNGKTLTNLVDKQLGYAAP
jgi:phosphoglycerate dehydrogenase-like enzyme